MRTLYTTQFDIGEPRFVLRGQPCDTLGDICEQWIRGKYLKSWTTTLPELVEGENPIPLGGHSLNYRTRREGDSLESVIEWSHPDDKDNSLRWAISVCWAQHNRRIQWRVSLGLDTTRDVLRPGHFLLGRPSVVGAILRSFNCKLGGWSVPSAMQLVDAAAVPRLVRDELLMAQRTLPVVVVAPDAQTGWFLANPGNLFNAVQGMCHVVALKDKWAAYSLTDCLEHRPLSCFDGGVRVYWPGLRTSDVPHQHPLFLKSTISKWIHSDEGAVAERLFRMFSGVTVLRQREGEVFRSVREAFRAAEGRRLEELRKSVVAEGERSKKLGSDLGAAKEHNALLEELTETLENDLKVVQAERDALLLEREGLRSDLAAQREQWAAFQQHQQSIVTEPDEDEEPVEESEPLSVCSVVLDAKDRFKDTLVFLDSAMDSARESPFKNPERVEQLLEALDTVAGEWREKKGTLGQTWEQALRALGFEFREHISETSRRKWGNEYQFVYKGKKLLFENHVTMGAKQPDTCLSVHMYRDEQELKLVIGHCGRHLTNTST